MPLGPHREAPREVVTFRIPRPDAEWIRSHLSRGLDMSKVLLWAIRLGREYFEALGPFEKEVEELAAREGLPRGQLVSDLLELGMAAYEKSTRRGRRIKLDNS